MPLQRTYSMPVTTLAGVSNSMTTDFVLDALKLTPTIAIWEKVTGSRLCRDEMKVTKCPRLPFCWSQFKRRRARIKAESGHDFNPRYFTFTFLLPIMMRWGALMSPVIC